MDGDRVVAGWVVGGVGGGEWQMVIGWWPGGWGVEVSGGW